MPRPKYVVRLTDEERAELNDLIRTGKRAASVLRHARILLKADAGAGGPDGDDARGCVRILLFISLNNKPKFIPIHK